MGHPNSCLQAFVQPPGLVQAPHVRRKADNGALLSFSSECFNVLLAQHLHLAEDLRAAALRQVAGARTFISHLDMLRIHQQNRYLCSLVTAVERVANQMPDDEVWKKLSSKQAGAMPTARQFPAIMARRYSPEQ